MTTDPTPEAVAEAILLAAGFNPQSVFFYRSAMIDAADAALTAARVEGARMALEEARAKIKVQAEYHRSAPSPNPSARGIDDAMCRALEAAERSIDALDPEGIVKEGEE